MDYICDHCKKQVKCKIQPSRDMLFDCGMYEKRKSPTNADRIRAMSDEELAWFLCGVFDEGSAKFICGDTIPNYDEDKIVEWLKTEVTE